MRNRFVALGLALALAGAAAGGGDVAAKTRLSLSSWGSPKHPQVSEFVDRFVKDVEKRTKGEVTFRTFSGGEFVQQQFVPTAVPQGTVDISLTTLDTWSGRIPEMSITVSPLWSFTMKKARQDLLPGSPVFEYFNGRLKENGAVMLTMFDIGPPVLQTRASVLAPKDIAGKTVRTYSKGASELLQAVGASPVTMGVGDVYSALQRGAVDGALVGIQGAVGLKHYEVTQHVMITNGLFGTLVHAYVMNKDKWNGLRPEIRKAIQEAATAARNHSQDFMIQSYGKFVQVFRDKGKAVTVVEPGSAAWKNWQAALGPLAEKDRKRYPADLVKLLESVK
jgi:TRAP-type C4-dicarboxylate transport system substrate-binding protein